VVDAALRRRLLRGIAAALLMLIPAGYFAISAGQSHNAAAAHKLRAERAGLVHGIPSAVQRAAPPSRCAPERVSPSSPAVPAPGSPVGRCRSPTGW
jgi:hypothetical protein